MIRSWNRRASIAGTLLVAGLLVFVLVPTPTSATPVSAAASASSSWSYGRLKTVGVGPDTAANGWIYSGNATLGYTVTVREVSTSSTTFELTVSRTMGLAFSLRFCDLSCAAPVQWANETFRAYENTTTFANFTDQGTVLQNGTSDVSALALENSTSFLHANVTESTDVYLPSAGQRGPHLGYLGANMFAQAAVSFAPALGLIPDQPIPGSTWNSTSEFGATGSADWAYYYSLLRPVSPVVIGPVSGTVALSANGMVSVQGSYPTGSNFPYGGAQYPAITLTIVGPFDVREGFIFIPTPIDIFGSAVLPWADNATGSASAQMSTLDLKLTKGAEPQIIASSWEYSTAAANAATSSAIATGSSGISADVANANPVATGTVQGQPETSEVAHNTQNCLIQGYCATPAAPRSFLGLIVIGGVAATVAVLIGVGVVARRRRTPPPVYPNAVLYPPGAAYPAAPAGTPATPTSPPPPEDDPLDHLW